jgi:hypothetical protein
MKRGIGSAGLVVVMLVLAALGAALGAPVAAAQGACAVVQGRVVCPDGGQGPPGPGTGPTANVPCQPGLAMGTVVCGSAGSGSANSADPDEGYLTRSRYTGWTSGCTQLGSAIRCGRSPWDDDPIGWPVRWIE